MRRAARNGPKAHHKNNKYQRFAVNGAAMLAGFYHRSVLRCGFLAERDPESNAC